MTTLTDKSKPGWKTLAVLLLVTLGGGGLVGFLTRNRTDFYDTLTKPVFAPPGWLFPIAWAILYAAMAVSIWLVLRTSAKNRRMLLWLYAAQLIVNLIWPFLFFTQQALGLAFVWLVLLWSLIIILMVRSFKVSAPAGWLLAPYLAWVTFAGVLNFCIARLN